MLFKLLQEHLGIAFVVVKATGNIFFLQWNYYFFSPDPVDSPLLNFFLNALGGQGGPAGQARAQRAEQGGGARYMKDLSQGEAPQLYNWILEYL